MLKYSPSAWMNAQKHLQHLSCSPGRWTEAASDKDLTGLRTKCHR